MTTITQGHTGQNHAHDSHGEAHGPARGLARWLFTTNHKDIGTLYLVFALVMLFVGGGMALVIRAELFQPGLQFVNPEFFNQMTTMHALIMVFGMIMPAFVGFANWMIPLQIGAADISSQPQCGGIHEFQHRGNFRLIHQTGHGQCRRLDIDVQCPQHPCCRWFRRQLQGGFNH